MSRIAALVLAALSLVACVSPEVGSVDVDGLVDPALPETEQPAPEAPAPPVAPARCLLLDFDPACVGQWADSADRFSRWRAHPDTGLGAFPCQVVDGQCDKPWYRDARCVEGALRLETTCARVGGTCEGASDGVAYCAL